MLTVSIKNRDMTEDEKIALEKLLEYVKNEFNTTVIAEHEVDSENIHFLQIHSKRTYNSRGAGRNANIDKQEICDYALSNSHYTITEIAKYFGCTKQYVSKVLTENNVMHEYKKLRKTTN